MATLDVIELEIPKYLSDTTHLSLDQHGAYLLILMAMRIAKGSLPDDDKVLANICRVSMSRWRKLAPVVRSFLISEGGRVTQKRVKSDVEKCLETSQKNARNGSKGGKAKALKLLDPSLATATVSPGLRQKQPSDGYSESLSRNSESKSSRQINNSRGSAISGEWQPTASEVEYGVALGMTTDEVMEAAENMRLWAQANRNRAVGRKADWSATFKGWLRRESGRKQSRGLRSAPKVNAWAAMVRDDMMGEEV